MFEFKWDVHFCHITRPDEARIFSRRIKVEFRIGPA
jgi:hypothetical protein